MRIHELEILDSECRFDAAARGAPITVSLIPIVALFAIFEEPVSASGCGALSAWIAAPLGTRSAHQRLSEHALKGKAIAAAVLAALIVGGTIRIAFTPSNDAGSAETDAIVPAKGAIR